MSHSRRELLSKKDSQRLLDLKAVKAALPGVPPTPEEAAAAKSEAGGAERRGGGDLE